MIFPLFSSLIQHLDPRWLVGDKKWGSLCETCIVLALIQPLISTGMFGLGLLFIALKLFLIENGIVAASCVTALVDLLQEIELEKLGLIHPTLSLSLPHITWKPIIFAFMIDVVVSSELQNVVCFPCLSNRIKLWFGLLVGRQENK